MQNRVSVGIGDGMESPSAEGSSPVTPHVWTHGVRMSPLVPLVSPHHVLQLARRPGRVDSAISTPVLSLSLACVVFSASPQLLRRARALASQRLRPSNSV